MRNGWDFSKTRAKLKDPLVIESEKRLLNVVLNVLRVHGHDLKLTTRDFDVAINHSPTDNLIIKCQALQYLLECGVHPMVALRTVGLWGDVEKVFLQSKPYLDAKWKTIDDLEAEQEKADKAMQEFNKQNGGGNA